MTFIPNDSYYLDEEPAYKTKSQEDLEEYADYLYEQWKDQKIMEQWEKEQLSG